MKDTEGWERGLVRALEGATADAGPLASRIVRSMRDPSALEASVRIDTGVARAGRMMVERAEADTARAIAEALSLPWGDASSRLVEAVAEHGLTLITGWDVGGRSPLYKLYANASDASVEVRRAVAAKLGGDGAPHVVGVNVHATRVAWKAYAQWDEEGALNVRVPAPLRDVDAAAWVVSRNRGDRSVRAVFVAPRDPDSAGRAVVALTGKPWSTWAAHMPFDVEDLRQLGWSPDGRVTLYAKPRGASGRLQRLSAHAVFRAELGGQTVEVGLHIEGRDAPRAYVRTAHHALTFRTRQGSPPRESLEGLGTWAARAVGPDPDTWDFRAPPPPWRLLGDDGDP